MSKNDSTRLEDCDNHYTIDMLYDRFGIDDYEAKRCMNCHNHRMEGGIITCKYILEGISNGGDDLNGN